MFYVQSIGIYFILFMNIIVCTEQQQQPCVYPLIHWIKTNEPWPILYRNQEVPTKNFTQCHIQWYELIEIDIASVNQNNRLWLILFQQYIVAKMNLRLLTLFMNSLTASGGINNNDVFFIDRTVITRIIDSITITDIAIVKAFDILDRYCDDMTLINYVKTQIYTLEVLSVLEQFNGGGMAIGYCKLMDGMTEEEGGLSYFIEYPFSVYTFFKNYTMENINNDYNNNNNNNNTNQTSSMLIIFPILNDTDIEQRQYVLDPFMIEFFVDKKIIIILFTSTVGLIITFIIIIIIYKYRNKFTIKKRKLTRCVNNIYDNIVYIFSCCGLLSINTYDDIEKYGDDDNTIDTVNIVLEEDIKKNNDGDDDKGKNKI